MIADPVPLHGRLAAERSAVLGIRTAPDGLEVHGVDMIEWNEAGRIVDFTGMVPPRTALQAVIARMFAALA